MNMIPKKKERKNSVPRIVDDGKETVIPELFEKLLRAMKQISGILEHKKTVTTFSDVNGVFASIMKQESRRDRITVFLNKSRGWKPTLGYDAIDFDEWRTGDVCVVVHNTDRSMKQAFILCREWKEAKAHYKPGVTVTEVMQSKKKITNE